MIAIKPSLDTDANGPEAYAVQLKEQSNIVQLSILRTAAFLVRVAELYRSC